MKYPLQGVFFQKRKNEAEGDFFKKSDRGLFDSVSVVSGAISASRKVAF